MYNILFDHLKDQQTNAIVTNIDWIFDLKDIIDKIIEKLKIYYQKTKNKCEILYNLKIILNSIQKLILYQINCAKQNLFYWTFITNVKLTNCRKKNFENQNSSKFTNDNSKIIIMSIIWIASSISLQIQHNFIISKKTISSNLRNRFVKFLKRIQS